MQAQAHEVAQFLLGDFRENNGRVDLYYRRGADGTPALFYVGADDLQEGVDYVWATPGFYEDPELERKLSSRQLPGFVDEAHEKWTPAPREAVLYLADDTGDVYRIRVEAAGPADTTLDVHVSWRAQP